jgi:hypothetical protein
MPRAKALKRAKSTWSIEAALRHLERARTHIGHSGDRLLIQLIEEAINVVAGCRDGQRAGAPKL